MKNNNNYRILLLNDHDPMTGIGNYIFGILNAFRKMNCSRYSFHMLMQNAKRSNIPDYTDISVQFRPLFHNSSNYGRTYDLFSYFYFPKLIPQGYNIYHISNQMMGRSILKVHPTVITCHDMIPFMFGGNHNVLVESLRKRSIAAMKGASFIIFVSKHTIMVCTLFLI